MIFTLTTSRSLSLNLAIKIILNNFTGIYISSSRVVFDAKLLYAIYPMVDTVMEIIWVKSDMLKNICSI